MDDYEKFGKHHASIKLRDSVLFIIYMVPHCLLAIAPQFVVMHDVSCFVITGELCLTHVQTETALDRIIKCTSATYRIQSWLGLKAEAIPGSSQVSHWCCLCCC